MIQTLMLLASSCIKMINLFWSVDKRAVHNKILVMRSCKRASKRSIVIGKKRQRERYRRRWAEEVGAEATGTEVAVWYNN